MIKKALGNLRITGYVKAVVTGPGGYRHVHLDEQNIIHSDYAEALCDAMMGAQDIALDNLFNGNTTLPPNGEDGITVGDGAGTVYELICSVVQSGADITIEGTLSGVAITIPALADVMLGHDYAHPIFNTMIANPGTWGNLVLLNTQVLTITWVIKHQSV